MFRALADPQRLRLLSHIDAASPEICVCDLSDGVPLVQPTVSHHLKVLKQAGLVRARRCGTWMMYRLSNTGMESLRKGVLALSSRKAPV